MQARTMNTILASVLLVVAVLLSACGGQPAASPAPTTAAPTTSVAPKTTAPSTTAPATPTATSTAAAYKLPAIMNFASDGGLGTTGYNLPVALGAVMEKFLGSKVRVLPMENQRETYATIRSGECPIASCSSTVATLAEEAASTFADKRDGPAQLRAMWFTYAQGWGYAVRADSPIKTIYDIKGKRFAMMTASPAVVNSVKGAIAFAGLTEKDVTIVPFGSFAAMVQSLAEGKADVAYAASASAASIEAEAAIPGGMRWLAMPATDTKGWAAFHQYVTVGAPTVMNEGVKSAIGVPSWGSGYWLMLDAARDDGLAYEITKFMWDHYADYKSAYDMLINASPENQRVWLDKTPFAYHPGAIKFFKEKGIWTADDDKYNASVIDLEKRYTAAWQTAIKQAADGGITVDPTNAKWMALWDQVRGQLPRFLIRTK